MTRSDTPLLPSGLVGSKLGGQEWGSKGRLRCGWIVALVVVVSACAESTEPVATATAIEEVQSSHIEAHVPDSNEQLPALISQGVEKYFSGENGPQLNVTIDLLRSGSTQLGVSTPKYYAWVQVYESGSLIHEGAVRVALIEQQYSEVTKFVARQEMQEHPEILERTFPRALLEKIQARMSN